MASRPLPDGIAPEELAAYRDMIAVRRMRGLRPGRRDLPGGAVPGGDVMLDGLWDAVKSAAGGVAKVATWGPKAAYKGYMGASRAIYKSPLGPLALSALEKATGAPPGSMDAIAAAIHNRQPIPPGATAAQIAAVRNALATQSRASTIAINRPAAARSWWDRLVAWLKS